MKIFNLYYLRTCFTKRDIAFSSRIQSLLQFFGIAVHNPYRDECCCDFECCNPYHDKRDRCWLHINKNQLPVRRKVWYEETAPIGTPNRKFVKKTKWILNFNKQ